MALDVKVGVKNPNAFPLPPGRLDYALSLAGSRSRVPRTPRSGRWRAARRRPSPSRSG
jgi:hypothetical protein